MRMGRLWQSIAALGAVALVATSLSGCGLKSSSAEYDTSGRGVAGQVAPSAPEASKDNLGAGEAVAGSTGTATSSAQDRMIIRSQTLRLQVKSTADSVTSLRDLAAEHGAVITDLQVATDSDQWIYRYDEYGYATTDGSALRGWVTVRVPADALDAFVKAAMGLGDVKYQSEASDDVTQEHLDLTARLENLRAEEQRLRGFFDAAKTVQDMLAVEAELNRIRGEIESLDAQVQYLERQAAMATVTIELTEDKPVVRPEGDSWGFSEAITAGFQGAAGVVKFAIAFIIATAPLWLLAVAAFFVIRSIVKKRREKRMEAEA